MYHRSNPFWNLLRALVDQLHLNKLPNFTTQRIAVKLSKTAQALVKQGHPWIFADSIVKESHAPKVGDLAIIYDNHTNKLIAIGVYDPESPIKIKVLHAGGPATINTEFFRYKVQAAFELRKPLLKTQTNAYRLIFGENDGLPSFIADVYDHVLVIKLYSDLWLPYLKMLVPHLIEVSKVDCVLLRLSRRLEDKLSKYDIYDGKIIYGELENEEVNFIEHGVNFKANVIKGHKTGYFLDHRHNRRHVSTLAKGKTMLDVFSYAGGFSVHALAKGAREVTSLDISEHALSVAEENATLNSHKGKHFTITGDAFEKLQQLIQKNQTYDIVVIDPPSFAKKAADVNRSLKKYAQLATFGAQLVSKGGLLVIASCSSRVLADDFFESIEKALRIVRKTETVEKTFHDVDHPIGFPEGAYLKTGYYRLP